MCIQIWPWTRYTLQDIYKTQDSIQGTLATKESQTMPRASRNSQAAAASAIVPDESLRTFYTHNPDSSTTNDDSMWSRRGGGSARATTTASVGGAGGGGNASNITDLSVSSTNSLNSPLQSSNAASEASSYVTRTIPGVIDEHDQDAMVEEEDEEEDDDDVVVVVRSSTSNARRRRQLPQPSEDGTEEGTEEHEQDDHHHHHHVNTSSHFSSRLLDESEEDELTNGTAAGGGGYYHNNNHGDNDSLIDAPPEEVEARALESLDWDTVGDDAELYKVDLERWKNISEKHQTPGTAEYSECVSSHYICHEFNHCLVTGTDTFMPSPLSAYQIEMWKQQKNTKTEALKEIQSDLLFLVQESEERSWMYPEPLPFTTHVPEPSSTIGQKLQISLPFSNRSTGGKGNDCNNWSDIAFNPLSTLTPLAPIGQATYPDTYRVQRALGAAQLRPSTSTSSHKPPFSNYHEHDGGDKSMNNNNQQQSSSQELLGYHGNAIPKRGPDFTWLDSEAEQILGDQELNFALKSKFPWATALSASNSNSNSNPLNNQQQTQQRSGGRENDSIVRGNGTSLTRDIGVIRLQ